tara:strand:- start:3511 stop:4122 length:612 start_codon:yes stop_codon:yes gene_type:complete
MSEVSDQFYSVELPSKGVFKSKGSKFFAYLFHCEDEESFKVQLDFIKTQEPSARHYCWALRIHPETLMERSSDDGEPAHTAGTPILRALLSHELVNIGCVVVRYFGGTKLGVPGLIEAYGSAAEDAIRENIRVEKWLTKRLKLQFSYDQLSFVERIVKQAELHVVERKQGLSLAYTLEVVQSQYEEIKDQFEKNHHITLLSGG